MKIAILTIEVKSDLSLVDLTTEAKRSLKLIEVTEKGITKIIQVQANRITHKMK